MTSLKKSVLCGQILAAQISALLFFNFSPAIAATGAQAPGGAQVGSGGPYVAKSAEPQRFLSYFDLSPNLVKAPLLLNMTNNGYKLVRVMISNRIIATEKDFGRGSMKTVDLTGTINPGTNQIVFQGAGTPGSTFSWKLTTSANVSLDKVDPDEALLGDVVTLTGSNFSNTASANQVFFNTKAAAVNSSSSNSMRVTVPRNADLGDNKVSVTVNGSRSKELKIVVRAVPELSSTNLQGVPPGYPLSIFGKNFSKNAADNHVFFNQTPADVVSATPTELVINTPTPPYEFGEHTPYEVTVKVGKIKSKNSLWVQIGPQMYKDPGLSGGPDTPRLEAPF